MKTTKYLRITSLMAMLYLAGCSTPTTTTSRSPAPGADQSVTTRVSRFVSLSKNAPAVVSIGEEFTYELIVTTQSEVSDVTVSDTVPEGAAYIRSDPEAVREGNKLSWKFQNVNPGESKTIRVTVKADAEGQLTHCATASAVPQVCITTLVGRPQLAITKTGPATAQLGQDVTYTVVVQNTGKTVAKNVVVTDTVPDGLSSPDDKRELSFPIGDLEPGGSKSIPVVLKTTKRGK